jgi:hypothetical protein
MEDLKGRCKLRRSTAQFVHPSERRVRRVLLPWLARRRICQNSSSAFRRPCFDTCLSEVDLFRAFLALLSRVLPLGRRSHAW